MSKKLLDEVYEQAGFDLTIDYSQAPIPGSSKEPQSGWAEHQRERNGYVE